MKQYRTGISGIERSIQQRNQTIDKNISQAFEDLSKLMDKVAVTIVGILIVTPAMLRHHIRSRAVK